ncbi:MAG: ankyrin repeat protein, partial [Chthonomonadales bacterium]|nr:ankyrin repeat protein [Chthonomonadales bacterium]
APSPAPLFRRFSDFVLRRSPKPIQKGPSAFEMACGSRWDAGYLDALNWPVRSEQSQLVQSMITHGARLNAKDKDGLTPLHWATCTGRPETVQVLVEHGATINNISAECGLSPLELACLKSPDSVRLLLEHGANTNEQTRDGLRTALHCAVMMASAAPSLNDYKRTTEIIRQLLAHGANPNIRDSKGRTAGEAAQWEDCPELVPLLRKAEGKM